MTLLVWLTVAYAAILVLALATSLTAIWLRLRGIDRALAAARESLDRVGEATTPLEGVIGPLRERLLDGMASAEDAAAELSAAEEGLQRRLERAPAGERG